MVKEINCPSWWRTSLEDIEETLQLVKKGTVTEIARSAGGRPIYLIEYGRSNVRWGTANLSSALGAHDIKHFADKSGEDYVPTVFLDGAAHGGEFEGTMSLLNLIKEIETGTDYDGRVHKELMELVSKVHLLIIPVSNPDGRSRIPFRSFLGRTFVDLRYYNQGTWKKDGELCGWPGCKMIHPIKEASDFLGAYFNDNGYNMMHEDYFGTVSSETGAVLDVCRKYAPDFSILLHGGTNSYSGILPYQYTTKSCLEDANTVSLRLRDRHAALNIPYVVMDEHCIGDAFSLPAAMNHVCGGIAVTYESNQGLVDAPGVAYDAEQIYTAHILLYEETCRFVLEKFSKK